MKILAVHLHTHDTSIALLNNEKIVYAAANERFSRKKMDARVPLKVLENCLGYTKTKPSDIDKVAIVGNPFPLALFKMIWESTWPFRLTKGRYLVWIGKPISIIKELIIATGIPSFFYREQIPRWRIAKRLVDFCGTTEYIDHHAAHLYSTYYTSGWEKCLVVCIEGSGSGKTFSIYSVDRDKWNRIVECFIPDSPGRFYELVTLLLGYDKKKHGGKITGLAGYGNSRKLYKAVSKIMWTSGLEIKLDYKKFLKWQYEYVYKNRTPKEFSRSNKEDIAAAFQKRLEDCIVEVLEKVVIETGHKNIALAGGVVANVKLNQKIHEISGVKKIHIHQAMGDSGLALGAALHVAHKTGYKVKRPDTIYFGPDYSDREMLMAIKKHDLKYRKLRNIEANIAKLLANGKVIARFNGKMEYGPRALGNRTILYQTTDKSVNKWLNDRLVRTEFMPFAPVTLDKYAEKCYKNLDGAEYPSRFMTITFDCTSYMKKASPAVVHVDGTARPQIIRRKDNPSYYKILSEYFKITGIPSLINTSFNMHGEPIVCSPEDALRSFTAGKLDYLAMGEYLVTNDNEKNPL